MSKAATGQNGALLGTAAYFSGLNHTGYLSGQRRLHSYRGALEGVASAAEAILDEVYGDLREHESVLRYIPAEGRNRLAGLDSFSRVSTVKEAVQWGETFPPWAPSPGGPQAALRGAWWAFSAAPG